jgi:hypothetical protein
MNHENETCEGCVHFEEMECGNEDNWEDQRDESLVMWRSLIAPLVAADTPACVLFHPSLECRQVRALEGNDDTP